ncbi:MAG: type II toxin-antitoxin system RelE/ParE family toxin, partial [Acidobacteriota bacterium]|nr:type II toxin-antitoxin system RelE/ParE family toxin [Acidobacteriota bacterium]
MEWEVRLHDDFEPEYDELPSIVRMEMLAIMTALRIFGPQLGRPQVDTLNGSKFSNMKELRFDAAG